MASTPRLGLSYPGGTDTADLHTWTYFLANSIEVALTQRIQKGTVSITGNGTTYRDLTVTFPTAFPTVPNVVVAVFADAAYHAAVGNVSTTSFLLRLSRDDAAVFSVTKSLRWLATDI